MENNLTDTLEEPKFKVIIKRSDLKKAEDLYNKGKISKIEFDIVKLLMNLKRTPYFGYFFLIPFSQTRTKLYTQHP